MEIVILNINIPYKTRQNLFYFRQNTTSRGPRVSTSHLKISAYNHVLDHVIRLQQFPVLTNNEKESDALFLVADALTFILTYRLITTTQ